MHVCVSAPEVVNNYSHELKPVNKLAIAPAFQFLYMYDNCH